MELTDATEAANILKPLVNNRRETTLLDPTRWRETKFAVQKLLSYIPRQGRKGEAQLARRYVRKTLDGRGKELDVLAAIRDGCLDHSSFLRGLVTMAVQIAVSGSADAMTLDLRARRHMLSEQQLSDIVMLTNDLHELPRLDILQKLGVNAKKPHRVTSAVHCVRRLRRRTSCAQHEHSSQRVPPQAVGLTRRHINI